jgi:hypothetical protein
MTCRNEIETIQLIYPRVDAACCVTRWLMMAASSLEEAKPSSERTPRTNLLVRGTRREVSDRLRERDDLRLRSQQPR